MGLDDELGCSANTKGRKISQTEEQVVQPTACIYTTHVCSDAHSKQKYVTFPEAVNSPITPSASALHVGAAFVC